MRVSILTREYPPTIYGGAGVHVEFLQAIPIYESERRFKNQHSAETLLERWEDAQVRFWDPRRAPDPAALRLCCHPAG